MRPLTRSISLAAFAMLVTAPAHAQGTGIMADLTKDMHDVHGKLVALAKAMPANTQDWRPAPGVRSTREVFLHVASDNYFIPTGFGIAPDPASKIDGKDMKTVAAYEKQQLGVQETADALNKSFGHLAKAMGTQDAATLNEKVKVFGMEMTRQQLWLLTVTHLHEHLGQAIAYARANNVTPPWSK